MITQALNPDPIKYKFFRTIGIDDLHQEKLDGMIGKKHLVDCTSTNRPKVEHRLLSNMNFNETLKYNHVDDLLNSKRRRRSIFSIKKTNLQDSKNFQPSKHISFDNNVKVIPIPQRSEYSNRIASRIWSRHEELMKNIERNIIEFESEGWDWRSVKEDDKMLIDCRTGERVHPIHVEVN